MLSGWQLKSRKKTIEEEITKLSPPWVGNKVELKKPPNSNNDELDKELTIEEINRAINDSKNKKTSPGKDQIEYCMIEKLPIKYKKELCYIFNDMWINSYIPENWRNYLVIFIDKKNK